MRAGFQVLTQLQVMPNNQTDVGKILMDSTNHREQLNEEFSSIHNDENVWNSEFAISFLEASLQELKDKKIYVKKKLNQLAEDSREKFYLRNEIDVLNKMISDYEASLTERNVSLSQMGSDLLASIRTLPDLTAKAIESFAYALVIFKNPEFAKQVRLDAFIHLLHAYYHRGLEHMAGQQLGRLICLELARRIIQGEVETENWDANIVMQFFEKDEENSKILNNAVELQLKLKADAFKKIYVKLRETQTGFFNNNFLNYKTNFLNGKEGLSPRELIDQIKAHIQDRSKGRTAKAWELAQKNYIASMEKIELLVDIKKWSDENKWSLKLPNFMQAGEDNQTEPTNQNMPKP